MRDKSVTTINEKKVYEFLESKGLGSFWKTFRVQAKPTVFLKPVRFEKNESKFKIGETKLGGRPHLPSHIPWPKGFITQVDFDEKKDWEPFIEEIVYPLLFLGQINLKDIAHYIPDIPKEYSKGILYFFISPSYDQLIKVDSDTVPKNAFKILFYNGPLSKLTPLVFPTVSIKAKDYDADFEDFHTLLQKVDIIPDITFPSNQYKLVTGIDILSRNKIQELCFDLFGNYAQVFGYPISLQDPPSQDTDKYMLLFCCHGPHEQICYFFIKKSDFKKGRFSKVELVIQGL